MADKDVVRTLLETTQHIFDVAQTARDLDDTPREFALALRPDGGMHFIMESPVSIEGAASYAGARAVWKIRSSRQGVSVEGRDGNSAILLREAGISLLRDEPRYRITSGLPTSCAISCGMGAGGASAFPILLA